MVRDHILHEGDIIIRIGGICDLAGFRGAEAFAALAGCAWLNDRDGGFLSASSGDGEAEHEGTCGCAVEGCFDEFVHELTGLFL